MPKEDWKPAISEPLTVQSLDPTLPLYTHYIDYKDQVNIIENLFRLAIIKNNVKKI